MCANDYIYYCMVCCVIGCCFDPPIYIQCDMSVYVVIYSIIMYNNFIIIMNEIIIKIIVLTKRSEKTFKI